mgnify:CR=1 FL=1
MRGSVWHIFNWHTPTWFCFLNLLYQNRSHTYNRHSGSCPASHNPLLMDNPNSNRGRVDNLDHFHLCSQKIKNHQSYHIHHNMPFIDTLPLPFLVHQRTMRCTYQGTFPLTHDRLLRVVTMRFQILLWKIPNYLRISPPQCPRRKRPTWCPNLRFASHTICHQFDLIRESVVDMGIRHQQAIRHLCLVLSSNLVLVWFDQIWILYLKRCLRLFLDPLCFLSRSQLCFCTSLA